MYIHTYVYFPLIPYKCYWYFPSGPVVKNPLANAGNKGLIPGLGRSHAVEQLNLYPTTTEPAF